MITVGLGGKGLQTSCAGLALIGQCIQRLALFILFHGDGTIAPQGLQRLLISEVVDDLTGDGDLIEQLGVHRLIHTIHHITQKDTGNGCIRYTAVGELGNLQKILVTHLFFHYSVKCG